MKQHYTAFFKQQVLTALDANHGNAYLTAKQFNIHRGTLTNWIKNREAIFAQSLDTPPAQRLKPSQQLDYLSQQLIVSLPTKVQNAKLVETIRAISMIDQLTKAIRSHEEKSNDHAQKLNQMFEKQRQQMEYDVIRRGGSAELAAFKKAQADMLAILGITEDEEDESDE